MLALALIVWISGSGATFAGDTARTAAEVTEDWRGMPRMLERVLAPEDPKGTAPRTVCLLLEPTAALASTGFAAALLATLESNPTLLERTKIGVARVGLEKALLPPSDDAAAINAAVKQALASPDARIQNVYADLRGVSSTLAARPGEKAILLCALENGDAEDDLEATVARVTSAKIRVHVLTTESYVADSYWAERSFQEKPRGTQLAGGDSALIDMPFGWLFQMSVANEVAPSGFGSYALSRVSAESGGRVYLYSEPSASAHRCTVYSTCLFCTNDHAPDNEVFQKARLGALAPSLASRADVGAALAGDPCHRATLAAWTAAQQAGLLRGEAPRVGRDTGVDSAAVGRASLLLSGAPDRNADRARTGIKDCERILAALDLDLKRADPARSSPRQRAIAEFTRLMLMITKVNLATYAGFCDEIAPRWFDKTPALPAPPEIPAVRGEGNNLQIGYHDTSLCHGARPFLEVELPGGPALREELNRLDAEMKAFLAQYGNTPYAIALDRQGIAVFQQAFAGTGVERARPKSKSAPDQGPSTGGTRPPRTGAPGSGSSTGPATGGGG